MGRGGKDGREEGSRDEGGRREVETGEEGRNGGGGGR